MKPPVETIRLSEQERRWAIQIKRNLGLRGWNTICRWALLISMSESEDPPPHRDISARSNVEVAWSTFAGSLDPILTGLALVAGSRAGDDLSESLKRHLHRGLERLSKVPSLCSLFSQTQFHHP